MNIHTQDGGRLPHLDIESFAYVPDEETDSNSDNISEDNLRSNHNSRSRRDSRHSLAYTGSYGGTKDDNYYQSKESNASENQNDDHEKPNNEYSIDKGTYLWQLNFIYRIYTKAGYH